MKILLQNVMPHVNVHNHHFEYDKLTLLTHTIDVVRIEWTNLSYWYLLFCTLFCWKIVFNISFLTLFYVLVPQQYNLECFGKHIQVMVVKEMSHLR